MEYKFFEIIIEMVSSIHLTRKQVLPQQNTIIYINLKIGRKTLVDCRKFIQLNRKLKALIINFGWRHSVAVRLSR